MADPERDILKQVVMERHHATGNVGVGFARGFKLKRGALGSTVAHDAVQAEMGLPVAGLVSDQPLDEVIRRIDGLNRAAHALGCDLEAPFMTLSILSLSPIPELKLTDQGLIDAVHLRKTSLFV